LGIKFFKNQSLLYGTSNKKPKKSVIKPGNINKKAAITKQNPCNISLIEFLSALKFSSTDLRVDNPCCFTKYIPSTAVKIVMLMVLKAPITEPILIIRYTSNSGNKIKINSVNCIIYDLILYIIINTEITTMSENFGYIDIILLAMLAGFIFLRLRNVLGKGADNTPIKHDFLKKAQENFSFVQDVQEKSKEPTFDESVFKKGAEYAYEMIINAFASGDKATLKTLLNKKLYEDFSLIIDERNEKKLKSELTFIGIKKLSIDKIKNDGTKYKVTARFVSEIITCLKNEKGEVIEGDPEKTKVTTDVWSFERDLKDKDLTWYLTELSSEETGQETKH